MGSLPEAGLTVLVTGGIGLTFALVAAILIGIGWINHRRAQASQQWPMVLGRVTGARVEANPSDDGGPTYSPTIRYAYDVGGRMYTNARLAFGGVTNDSNPAVAQRAVARYPAGAIVQVYYNPANPQDAVLERRAGISRFMFGLGGVFLVLGCCLPVAAGGVVAAGLLMQPR